MGGWGEPMVDKKLLFFFQSILCLKCVFGSSSSETTPVLLRSKNCFYDTAALLNAKIRSEGLEWVGSQTVGH